MAEGIFYRRKCFGYEVGWDEIFDKMPIGSVLFW